MTKEPKLYFDSEKEMFDCLDEWQARLGLSDWKIAARICGNPPHMRINRMDF